MKKAINLFLTIGLLASLLTTKVFAQAYVPGNEQNEILISGSSGSILLPNMNPFSFDVKKGHIKVRTDFGGNYWYKSIPIPAANEFNIDITFDVNYFNSSNLLIHSETQRIINIVNSPSNISPEGAYVKNLSNFIDNNASSSGFSSSGQEITRVEISGIALSHNGSTNLTAASELKIYLSYNIDYAIDPDQTPNSIMLDPFSLLPNNPHVVKFSWTTLANKNYPNYQLQLLRLYNEDDLNTGNEQSITIKSALDWSKALTFETESKDKEISLFIGEGTGYYIWRVRTIGTREGGISNSNNWGAWGLPNSSPVLPWNLSPPPPANDVFFFTDPERDKNYIYSRTFTEGNNVSEKITYATNLNQVKQTQVYLPSNEKSVVSQSVLDFSGRPAITTLPVPVDGGLAGYKEGFVKSPGGSLFKADLFDKDVNVYNPPTVDDVNTPFKYYSNQNTDEQIPNAEQFPYTRTVFETDGSGRVKEQSGAGLTHMLDDNNNQGDGRGRTVRTYYETPAQEELIRMFGDEAPLSENVFKTITVDQNNTASVTFTNKEGKVIATGLTFEEDDNLEPLETAPVEDTYHDYVTKNVQVNDKTFVSTKKLTVLTPTPLTLDYRIKCITLASLCNVVNLKCGFSVKVIIHNPDQKGITHSLGGSATTINTDLELIEKDIETPLYDDCSGSGYKIVSDLDDAYGTIMLEPGNYIIEKVLIQHEPATGTISENTENINNQISPITNWVTSTLAKVDCEKELMMFYNDLYFFVQQFKTPNGSPDPTLKANNYNINFNYDNQTNTCPGCSETSYSGFPPEFQTFFETLYSEYTIELYDASGQVFLPGDLPFTENSTRLPYRLYIKTPCCLLADLSVLYTPDFRCPSVNELKCFKENVVEAPGFSWSSLQINTDYFEPANAPANGFVADFEGYAISMMKQCFKSDVCDDACAVQIAKGKLYDYMRGWHSEKVFNQMVYHMLTDEYNCENYPLDGSCVANPSPACDPTPDPPIIPVNNGYDSNDCASATAGAQVPNTQYNCKDLAACWKGIILMLMQQTCPNPDVDFNANGDGGKISEEFDKQQHGDQSKHDDHFDDNFDVNIPWPFGWFLETLMSARMRARQNVDPANGGIRPPPPPMSNFNMVNMFLNCTGYKFADVIDKNSPNYPTCSEEKTEAGYISLFSDPTPPPLDCFIGLYYDFDSDPTNGEYYTDVNPTNASSSIYAELGLTNGGYNSGSPITTAEAWSHLKVAPNPSSGPATDEELWEMFGNIRNPVYAFKYYEYEYTSRNNLEQTTCFRDPNKCYDENGNTVSCCKDLQGNDIPCYFCGIGNITCQQTKENWNCGQRYSFFEMLKGYRKPDDDNNLEQTVLFPDNCTRRYTPSYWYDNPMSNPDSRGSRYLTPAEWATYYGQAVGQYAQYLLPLPSNYHAFLHLDGTIDDPSLGNYTQISLVEADAAIKMQSCKNGCEDRREEFKAKIMKMFTDRCYTIGGCKMSPNDNVVPVEDIDLLVDKLVEQCQSQCKMTTFSCVDDMFCRDLDSPPTDYINNLLCTTLPEDHCIDQNGWKYYRYLNNFPQGATGRSMEIQLGVGGVLNGQAPSPYPASTGTPDPMIKYDIPTAGQDPFTFAEKTLWLQAREWDFDLDIISKCNDITNQTMTVIQIGGYPVNAYSGAYYNSTLPFTSLFVKDIVTGLYIPQNFDITNCPPQGPPPNEFDPNTAIERSNYVTNTAMPDPDTPPNTPVRSPKVGIQVNAPQ